MRAPEVDVFALVGNARAGVREWLQAAWLALSGAAYGVLLAVGLLDPPRPARALVGPDVDHPARRGRTRGAVPRDRVLVIEPPEAAELDRLDAELHVVARVTGTLDPGYLDRLARRHRPRAVLSKRPLDSLDASFLAVCEQHDLAILVLANPTYGLFRPVRWHRYGGQPWLLLRRREQGRGNLAKRLFDIATVVITAPITVPMMLVITALIAPTGTPLYRQQRIGAGGRPFAMIKFRSMYVDAESATGPVLCADWDPRVTPVGRRLRKLRLDELPQLWNVLIGDMSLVGPRPERPEFVAELRSLPHYDHRHLIRPGLTGIAQLTGGYAATAEEKLRCDLLYVNSRSVRSDLRLLVLTATELLRGFPRG